MSPMVSNENKMITAVSKKKINLRSYVVVIVLLLQFIFFSILLHDRGFLSFENFLYILCQSATISIMATAMTFVITSAEIDLSVGNMAGLASVTTAMAVSRFGLVTGIITGLLTGLLFGCINGLLVTRVGIPSFMTTLSMMGFERGISMWISQTAPQPIRNNTYNSIFGGGNIGHIPSILIWTFIIVFIGYIILSKTIFGRQVMATGENETTARYTGINTKQIKFIVMTASSITAALSGMLYAGIMHSSSIQWGDGDEMSVIAAVILGGTSLYGGRGSVINSFIGSLMIGLINNGLILLGLHHSQQLMIRGLVIILVVAFTRRK